MSFSNESNIEQNNKFNYPINFNSLISWANAILFLEKHNLIEELSYVPLKAQKKFDRARHLGKFTHNFSNPKLKSSKKTLLEANLQAVESIRNDLIEYLKTHDSFDDVSSKEMQLKIKKLASFFVKERLTQSFKEKLFNVAIENSATNKWLYGLRKLKFFDGNITFSYNNHFIFKSLVENLICIKLFKDIKENVLFNLNTFAKAYKSGFISNENEKYQRLYKLYEMISENYTGKLFTEDLSKYDGVKEDLYDAFKDMQRKAFQSIKNSLYTFDENDLDEKLTKRIGVKVYEIGAEDKRFLIHVTRFRRSQTCLNNEATRMKIKDTIDKIFIDSGEKWEEKKPFISLSYISNSNGRTFRDCREFVTVVYSNDVPDEHLITICNQDAFTGINKDNGEIFSYQQAFYGSADQLLEQTDDLNEIAILKEDPLKVNSGETNKPVAIFCNKFISSIDIEFAKMLGVPIIYSTSEKIKIGYHVSEMEKPSNSDALEQDPLF